MKIDTSRPKEATDNTKRSLSPERQRSPGFLETHVMGLSSEETEAANLRQEAKRCQLDTIIAALNNRPDPSLSIFVRSNDRMYKSPSLGLDENGEDHRFTRVEHGGKEYVVPKLGFNKNGECEEPGIASSSRLRDTHLDLLPEDVSTSGTGKGRDYAADNIQDTGKLTNAILKHIVFLRYSIGIAMRPQYNEIRDAANKFALVHNKLDNNIASRYKSQYPGASISNATEYAKKIIEDLVKIAPSGQLGKAYARIKADMEKKD